MHFSSSAITAVVVIVANSSANTGVRKKLLLDSKRNFPRRGDAKPMWEKINGPTLDRSATLPDEEHECDIDVGILGCGKDQACIPSPQSKRGGVCRQVKLPEQNIRELQDSNATMLPADERAQSYYMDFCQDPDPDMNCDCSKFDSATWEGEISCTEPWCDYVDNTLCGTRTFAFSLQGGSVIASYCMDVSTERFCYSSNVTTYSYECLSASINGCECDCVYTPNGCSPQMTGGFLFSCPNDITTDGCNGFGSLFGNKVAFCDTPPQSPSSTLAPSKPPTDDAPVATETEEPSASPAEKTSPPTSSSSMDVKNYFQAASAVTSMAVLLSNWV
jgi:hypothetical protein